MLSKDCSKNYPSIILLLTSLCVIFDSPLSLYEEILQNVVIPPAPHWYTVPFLAFLYHVHAPVDAAEQRPPQPLPPADDAASSDGVDGQQHSAVGHDAAVVDVDDVPYPVFRVPIAPFLIFRVPCLCAFPFREVLTPAYPCKRKQNTR